MALNAIKHGLCIPIHTERVQHVGAQQQALDEIAKLIVPECISNESAHRIALTILELERNEAAQRLFFINNSVEPKRKPSGEALVELVRQRYPEYDMLQEAIEDELESKSRPDKRWISQGIKIMQQMQVDYLEFCQRAEAKELRRWKSSQRYLKRSANQLAKALRADTGSQT